MLKKLTTPLREKDILELKAGDKVLLSGVLYTARDRTHQRLVETLTRGKSPPFDLKGQVLFYAGPTPPKPGKVMGSIGPTTASRLDSYTPLLLEHGLKGMIGKGARREVVKEAIRKNRAVYFAAIGGAAAYLSQFVKKAEIFAYEDLGPEAIYRLEVRDFPLVVAIDAHGGDLFLEGPQTYQENQ